MGLYYKNLNHEVRKVMLDEVHYDERNTGLYLGKTLNERGIAHWPHLLKDAIQYGTDTSLADTLLSGGYLKTFNNGRKVASDAHTKLAEGEFNRFYVRAIYLVTLKFGQENVIAYRARASVSPRPKSEEAIGNNFLAQDILFNLREDPYSKIIPPNSGISFHIPE